MIYTATGQSVPNVPNEPRKDWFVGEAGGYRVHLIYRPDLEIHAWQRAALTLPLAMEMAKAAKGKAAREAGAGLCGHQVHGAEATDRRRHYVLPVPYSVHRVLGEAPDV